MNGKQVIARLKDAGWTLARINGSHHILQRGGEMVPVPVHGTHDLTPGVLAAIARQTGVKLK
jgi:predicted RNA binding protein YcfA (HicA-like mRNA interferase family)